MNSRKAIYLLALLAVTAVNLASGHICMISPEQRGGFNITGPGNNACFEPVAPCGRKPAGNPQDYVLTAGSGAYVLVQQNLNHYSPGNPGWIDVGFSPLSNPTESDFVILAQIPDVWVGQQWNQKNFSIPFAVPHTLTSHGVLRIRYHPNKPTEPIFHQCADVSVVAASSLSVPALFAVVDDIYNDDNTQLMLLNGTTETLPVNTQFGIRSDAGAASSSSPDFIITDGVIGLWGDNLTFLGQSTSDWAAGTLPNTMYTWVAGTMTPSTITCCLTEYDIIVALVQPANPYSAFPFYAVVLTDDSQGQQEQYSYNLYAYSQSAAGSTLKLLLGSGSISNSWVNFAGAVAYQDDASGTEYIYVLAMDENAPTGTHNTLLTFVPSTLKVTSVVLDNSAYNVGFIYPGTEANSVLSFSPGPWPRSSPQWNLVQIDAVSGDITSLAAVSIPGIQIADNYRGVVRQNAVSTNHLGVPTLTHVFTDARTDLSVACTFDLTTPQNVATSFLDLGVNTYRRARDLIAVP